MEEGQRDLAGVVMRINPVGHRAVAARRRLVAVDPDLQRDDRAFGGTRDARPVAPVDHRMRQHEQEVADARRAIAQIGRHHLLDQRRDLRPDAFQRGDRCKQRVEQGRAHVCQLRRHGRARKADTARYPRYMRRSS